MEGTYGPVICFGSSNILFGTVENHFDPKNQKKSQKKKSKKKSKKKIQKKVKKK